MVTNIYNIIFRFYVLVKINSILIKITHTHNLSMLFPKFSHLDNLALFRHLEREAALEHLTCYCCAC